MYVCICRFDYSIEFLRWALKPPEFKNDWHVGVRAEKSGTYIYQSIYIYFSICILTYICIHMNVYIYIVIYVCI